MGTLFTILGVLFLTLFILIPLIERFGRQYSPEELSKLSRWVLPLILVLMLLQAIRYFFF